MTDTLDADEIRAYAEILARVVVLEHGGWENVYRCANVPLAPYLPESSLRAFWVCRILLALASIGIVEQEEAWA